jgi:hypothetical protein
MRHRSGSLVGLHPIVSESAACGNISAENLDQRRPTERHRVIRLIAQHEIMMLLGLFGLQSIDESHLRHGKAIGFRDIAAAKLAGFRRRL